MATGTVTTQADLAGKAEDTWPSNSPRRLFSSLSRSLKTTSSTYCVSGYGVSAEPDREEGGLQGGLGRPGQGRDHTSGGQQRTERDFVRPPGRLVRVLGGQGQTGCPTPEEIDRIAEAKASRDVLVHNRGVAGKTYESKAGKLARYKDGQRIDIPEHYHRETWELIRKVITDISNAAIAKVP